MDQHGRVCPFAYADDLLLVIHGGTRHKIEQEAELVLKSIADRDRQHGLIFNPLKTKCLIRKPKACEEPDPVVRMDGAPLVLTDEATWNGWNRLDYHVNQLITGHDSLVPTCTDSVLRSWASETCVTSQNRTIFT